MLRTESRGRTDARPQDQHWQRRSFQSLCRSFPSWVSINPPPPDQHWQRWSFQSLCRSFPSWVSIDPPPPPGSALAEVILPKSLRILSKLSVDRPPPGSALAEAILPKSLRILSKLSVDRPPPPPRISIGRGDPSKVFADPFQVECRSTPPHKLKLWIFIYDFWCLYYTDVIYKRIWQLCRVNRNELQLTS